MAVYLITVEDDENGMWWEDPAAFDTKEQARAYATTREPPKGYSAVMYRCDEVEVIQHQ